MQNRVSLREQRRIETVGALHAAAVELVAESDPGTVTVEAIAERAGTSKRTFFNHFTAKEDAILGLRDPVVHDDDVAAFRGEGSGDLLTRTVRLMGGVVRSAAVPGSSFERRRRLLARYPDLARRMVFYVAVSEDLAAEVLLGSATSPALQDESARALLGVAGAINRFAVVRATSGQFPNEAELDAATAVFSTVLKNNR